MVSAPEWRVERVAMPARRAVVYRVDGVLGDGPACWRFLDEVRQDIRSGPEHIVLNLRGVPHATSPGIGILAACCTSAARAQKDLALSSLSKGVADVLQVMGLASVARIFTTEEAALDAMRA